MEHGAAVDAAAAVAVADDDGGDAAAQELAELAAQERAQQSARWPSLSSLLLLHLLPPPNLSLSSAFPCRLPSCFPTLSARLCRVSSGSAGKRARTGERCSRHGGEAMGDKKPTKDEQMLVQQ